MKEDMFTLLITAKSKMRKLLIHRNIYSGSIYKKKHWYKKPKLIHFHREDTNNKKRTP